MKKFLPKSIKNPSGFTLIELLVVIAIIAILSVIGIAVYSGVQKNTRDARRKADIDAIAQSLETAKTIGSTTYPIMANAMFASGSVPVDPTSTNVAPDSACPGVCKYCVKNAAGNCAVADTTVAPGAPAAAATWTVCANLEATGNYCRSNAQ